MGCLELLDHIEDVLNSHFAGECYAAPELIGILDKIDEFKIKAGEKVKGWCEYGCPSPKDMYDDCPIHGRV